MFFEGRTKTFMGAASGRLASEAAVTRRQVGGGCWARRRYRRKVLGRYFGLGGLSFGRQCRRRAESLLSDDQTQRSSATGETTG